jgi:hypothetical protein
MVNLAEKYKATTSIHLEMLDAAKTHSKAVSKVSRESSGAETGIVATRAVPVSEKVARKRDALRDEEFEEEQAAKKKVFKKPANRSISLTDHIN